MDWHTGYTVILIGLAILVGYEMYAATSQVLNVPKSPTISQAVWRLTRRYPWVRWVGTAVAVVLVLHFWFGLWAPEGTAP